MASLTGATAGTTTSRTGPGSGSRLRVATSRTWLRLGSSRAQGGPPHLGAPGAPRLEPLQRTQHAAARSPSMLLRWSALAWEGYAWLRRPNHGPGDAAVAPGLGIFPPLVQRWLATAGTRSST